MREATYLSEQPITPGPQRSSMDRALGRAFGVGGGSRSIGSVTDSLKWTAVYYHVRYVSQAGLLIEKDAYVLTYRDGAVWAVEGLHIDGVTE